MEWIIEHDQLFGVLLGVPLGIWVGLTLGTVITAYRLANRDESCATCPLWKCLEGNDDH